jgi:hypothetical protein
MQLELLQAPFRAIVAAPRLFAVLQGLISLLHCDVSQVHDIPRNVLTPTAR